MATAYTGPILWGSGNQDMQEFWRDRDIAFLDAARNPGLALLKARPDAQRSVNSVKLEWAEKLPLAQAGTVEAHAAGSGTIVVEATSDINLFVPNQTCKIVASTTGAIEIIFVKSVDYGTRTLTVEHSIGSPAAIAQILTDPIYIIGSNMGDDGSFITPVNSDYDDYYNYIQNFSTSIQISDYQRASKGVPGNKLIDLTKEKGIDHAELLEYSFLYGYRDTKTINNVVYYFTSGCDEVIQTNKLAPAGGTITKADLDAWLAPIFDYGPSERICLCNNKFFQTIHDLMDEKVWIRQDVNIFGWRVERYISPYGDLILVRHPLMTRHSHNKDLSALVLDFDQLRYKSMTRDDGQSLDTHLKLNIGTPGKKGLTNEFETYAGFMIKNEIYHGKAVGITGATP